MPEDTTLLDVTPPGRSRRRRLLSWVAGPTVALAVLAAAGAAWVHRSDPPAAGPTAAGPVATTTGDRAGGSDPERAGDAKPTGGAEGMTADPAGNGAPAGPGPVIDQRSGPGGAPEPAGPTASAAAALGGPTSTEPAGTTVSVGYTFHPGTTVFASADPGGTPATVTPLAGGPGVTPGAGERVPVDSITVTRSAAAPATVGCGSAEAAYDVSVAFDRTATGSVPNQFRLPGQTLTLDPGVARPVCAVPGTTWTLTYPDGTVARSGTV